MNKKRPKHLAVHKIRLPLPGIVSIFHRISGTILFLALPGLLWMFQASLNSAETYKQFVSVTEYTVVKLALITVMWGFIHHFCAGIRFLLIDLHVISSLNSARTSGKWVMALSLLLTVLTGVRLW